MRGGLLINLNNIYYFLLIVSTFLKEDKRNALDLQTLVSSLFFVNSRRNESLKYFISRVIFEITTVAFKMAKILRYSRLSIVAKKLRKITHLNKHIKEKSSLINKSHLFICSVVIYIWKKKKNPKVSDIADNIRRLWSRRLIGH